jgi:hypothetical protein
MKQEEIDELKSFRVSVECHSIVKEYCKQNSLKVNQFVSNLLIKTIKEIQKNETRKRNKL